MDELKFQFWGAEHLVNYEKRYNSHPTRSITFTVYSSDGEMKSILTESTRFVYYDGSTEKLTWNRRTDSIIAESLSVAIAEALIVKENLRDKSPLGRRFNALIKHKKQVYQVEFEEGSKQDKQVIVVKIGGGAIEYFEMTKQNQNWVISAEGNKGQWVSDIEAELSQIISRNLR